MKHILAVYQWCVAMPILLVMTIITALLTIFFSLLGMSRRGGYYPAHFWAKLWCILMFVKVVVKGRENIDPKTSYVFVANHQGAFDIFLIYGYLNRNFKWMMKRQLRNMPLVGKACEASHQIFVDKRGPARIRETYDKARDTLRGGMSVVVFPEGARWFTGHMGVFKRGAFMLADELQLDVVPITINGSFNVMPRMRDMKWVLWHPLRLTIHKPIAPKGQGADNIKAIEKESYDVVMSGLVDEYKGFVENPDQ